MKSFALLTLFGALSIASAPPIALAQSQLPQANANGDFIARTSHQNWVVVDPDASGLNCRWSSQMPVDWYAPHARLPRMNVVDWAIVRRFRTGASLIANTTPAGFATITDTRGLPWLKVSIGSQDQICLVRANRRFIRPI